MTERSPSLPRRVAVAAALLVPLVVDPFGADTQGLKGVALGLCGLLALLFGALEDLSGRRERPGPFLPETLLLLLAAWAALSIGWAVNRELAVTRVLLLLGMVGVARGVRAMASASGQSRRWLVGLIVVGAAAMALDAGSLLRAQEVSSLAPKHASWMFVHNNMAASYVTMLAPLVVALMLGAASALAALAWLVVLAGLLSYLGLLGSRAGVLGALLGVCVVGLLFLLRRRLSGARPPGRGTAAVLAVLVLLAALLPFSDTARGLGKDLFYRAVSTRAFSLGDAAFRPSIWSKTFEMVKARPLLGVGAGNFVVAFPRYEHQLAAKPHAHNDAMQVLAELGVPGLLLFLALLGSTLWMLARALCADRSTRAYVSAAGLVGSLVVLAVSGQFEVPFALGGTASVAAVLIGVTGALQGGASAREASGRPSRAAALAMLLVTAAGVLLLAVRVPGSLWLHEADAAAAAGETDRALQLYGRVAALRTGSYYPESRQSDICLQRGDATAALRHCEAARSLWPWGTDLMEAQGDVCVALNRLDEAAAHYAEAVESSPTRSSAFFKLVRSLAQSGRLQEAIDRLQYRVRSIHDAPAELLQPLADMWRRRADQTQGEDKMRAYAAARHFYAVLLQEGDVSQFPEFNERFKDLTHRLQRLTNGQPLPWFDIYRDFLVQSSMNMPNTALWTSMDADGRRLFPGWVEPFGPPVPGSWRER